MYNGENLLRGRAWDETALAAQARVKESNPNHCLIGFSHKFAMPFIVFQIIHKTKKL